MFNALSTDPDTVPSLMLKEHDARNPRPSSTRSAHLSRFFVLPAEIRNLIYEYALTYDGGLEVVIDRSTGVVPRLYPFEDSNLNTLLSTRIEANQFKYVCRQLEQDTLRLELASNNTLTFQHSDYTQRYQIFVSFYSRLRPEWKDHIKRGIAIEPGPAEYNSVACNYEMWYKTLTGQDQAARAFHDICRLNPKLKVILRYDALTMGSNNIWFLYTVALQKCLRGKCDAGLSLNLMESREVADLEMQMSSVPTSGKLLENLRMSLSATFDEEEFHQQLWWRLMNRRRGAFDKERHRLGRRLFEEGV